ncbi:putative secondary metabolism biosynthetic enzyme [Microsporum audouinii]
MTRETIFITGATGFIGSQTAQAALEAGYYARLSVRHEMQVAELQRLFHAHSERVECVVVPDLTSVETLQNVMDGVSHVIHIASPLPGSSAGNDIRRDFVNPAVNGVLAVLKSASVHPCVRRVVLMSSFGALIPLGALTGSYVRVRDNADAAIPVDLDMALPPGEIGTWLSYQGSKILAHQAGRDWARHNARDLEVVSMHPGYVLGHSLVQKTAADISGMNAVLWSALNNVPQAGFVTCCVHVQDVADACLRALDAALPKPYMEFLLAGREFTWSGAVEVVKSRRYPILEAPPEAGPFGGWTGVDADVSAAEEILGLRWRSQEQIVGDLIEQQLSFASQRA